MTVYRDRPILPFIVEWREGASETLQYDASSDVIGFGDAVIEPLQQHATNTGEITIALETQCEINRAERFIHLVRGMRKSFWCPRPGYWLAPISQHSADEINIQACGLAVNLNEHASKHVCISDGAQVQAARILAVIVIDSQTERIKLDAPLTFPVTADCYIAQLLLVRFSSDEQTMEFNADHQATWHTAFTELPLEYPLPGTGQEYIYLYEFRENAVGVQNTYAYTSYDQAVSFGAHIWQPRPFSHGELMERIEGDGDTLDIQSFRFDGNPLNSYFPFPPQREMSVSVYEWIRGTATAKTIFSGNVRTVELSGRRMLAKCSTLIDAGARSLPRFYRQARCQYQLFDSATCKVNAAAYTVATTIVSQSGRNIVCQSLGSHPANYYAFGRIQTVDTNGRQVVRGILASNGGQLTLNYKLRGVANGAPITVLPGCDLSIATCTSKFANPTNFGGMPHCDQNLTLKAVKLKQSSGGKGGK
jgi:uncharacterized phage protein (TIGR02218 family)